MNNNLIVQRAPNKVIYQDNNFHLSIQSLAEEHVEQITEAIQISTDSLLTFMDWAHGDISIESQRKRVAASKEDFQNGNEYNYSVFDVKTNNFMMSVSLFSGKNRNNKSLEIGYWTSSRYSNRGLATLMTKILTVLGFERIGSDRIEIGCNKENKASKRVIEKCEFHFEGEIKNYFKKVSQEMISNGYCPKRNYLQYSLISDDLTKLAWYVDVKKRIKAS